MELSEATIFELIPQNDGYYLLKNSDGACLWHNKGDYWFSWGGGYAYSFLDCNPNNNNLWKNAHGQVYMYMDVLYGGKAINVLICFINEDYNRLKFFF